MSEVYLNYVGKNRFQAFSAGSHPTGTVNPFAIKQLERVKLSTENLRSKSWSEFSASGAPKLDFVFTVCDDAANETCPVWPGQPITAHWGVSDPAKVKGSDAEIEKAFQSAFIVLSRRIDLFLSLRLDALDNLSIKSKLDEIGRTSS